MIVPFYTKADSSAPGMHPEQMPKDTQAFELKNPAHKPFFDALLTSNRYAFTGNTDMTQGALALPGWVLLDCYLLPSSVVGFAQRAANLPVAINQALMPPNPTDLIPIAAYTAVPAATPGHWVGISLFSLVTGGRIGLRTKAMALAYYGAKQQWGITQYDNASLRVHSQFGPLRLMSSDPPIHTFSHKTFTYLLDVPPVEYLMKVVNAGDKPVLPAVPSPTTAEWIATTDIDRMKDLRRKINESPGRYAMVYPGARAGAQGQEVLVADLGSSAG